VPTISFPINIFKISSKKDLNFLLNEKTNLFANKLLNNTHCLHGLSNRFPFRPGPGVFVVNIYSNLSDQIERIVVL